MPDLLRLSVSTPGKMLLDVANVSKVRLKLADQGWLSIYPRHAPLLAETLAGPLTYTVVADNDKTGAESRLALSESILQVADNHVMLFSGGELAASTPSLRDETDVDTDAARFDRLASVLLQSLRALPPEGVAGLDFESGGERA